MIDLELDFVVFVGDPDDGTPALASGKLLAEADKHKGALKFPHVYGAITISKGGKEIVPRKADPILPLVTAIVRAVRYVIDGEPETALFGESEHGFMFEPSGEDVYVSYFIGDPYEPEKHLLPRTPVKLAKFGEQVLALGERLKAIVQATDTEFYERDDHAKSLIDFLQESKESFRTFQLEVERGLRV